MKLKLLFTVIICILLFSGCEKNDGSVDHPRIFIPTVFSPDNNKLNDVFRPTGEDISKVSGFLMIITDENGYKLYTTDNLTTGWNGLQSNGEHYPIGFYFYDIWFKYNDKTEERVTGTVELTVGGW